jgi:hypothetical protein
VKASPGPCRCFILKLSCHSINIFVGLRELENSLHRGVVASFQLGLWDDIIFLGIARCTFVVCRRFFFAMLNSMSTVVCRRLVVILDPPVSRAVNGWGNENPLFISISNKLMKFFSYSYPIT